MNNRFKYILKLTRPRAGIIAMTLFCGLALICVFIAWKKIWTLSVRHSPLFSYQDFVQAEGYELAYDLYIPNSFTGWTPNPGNKLTWNKLTRTYEKEGIDISQPQIDEGGARFKITSIDWETEFGVAITNASNDQSKLGIPDSGSVIRLRHYANSRDIYFELPEDNKAGTLNIKVKITSQDYHPTALLHVEKK